MPPQSSPVLSLVVAPGRRLLLVELRPAPDRRITPLHWKEISVSTTRKLCSRFFMNLLIFLCLVAIMRLQAESSLYWENPDQSHRYISSQNPPSSGTDTIYSAPLPLLCILYALWFSLQTCSLLHNYCTDQTNLPLDCTECNLNTSDVIHRKWREESLGYLQRPQVLC